MFSNNTLLILVVIIVILFLYRKKEPFSTSGLAISDKYCTKLSDIYYRPEVNSPVCRNKYRKRICGRQRRNMVNFRSGNYFEENGMLV